jgi:hypothetical protein
VQGNAPSFQHPIDPVAVAAAREAARYLHPSNQQENYSNKFRISHPQAGKLGVAINNGKQCIVTEKLNQNLQLNLNDIILSVNGHKYEDVIKSEGGKSAWLKLFQGPGVREFIVLRPRENNVLDVTEEPTKELQPVASQWKTGKSSHQTSECKAAIRSCLLAGMRPCTIAKHVVKQVHPEHQATEYERAKSCAQRIQKSMSKEFEIATVDLHDIMKVGMPFQRKGVVFKRGDQPPKRKAISVLEQGLLDNHDEDNARKQSRLCSQNEELIGQQTMFSSLFSAADKQCISSPVGKLITPSNSMEEEEPVSPLSVK